MVYVIHLNIYIDRETTHIKERNGFWEHNQMFYRLTDYTIRERKRGKSRLSARISPSEQILNNYFAYIAHEGKQTHIQQNST